MKIDYKTIVCASCLLAISFGAYYSWEQVFPTSVPVKLRIPDGFSGPLFVVNDAHGVLPTKEPDGSLFYSSMSRRLNVRPKGPLEKWFKLYVQRGDAHLVYNNEFFVSGSSGNGVILIVFVGSKLEWDVFSDESSQLLVRSGWSGVLTKYAND